MTWWILGASAIAFGTKLLGYLLPEAARDDQRVRVITGAMTVGLLAALVATSAFTTGHALVLDARALAVVVAIAALRFRAPFIVVVLLGAAAVAIGRLAGLG